MNYAKQFKIEREAAGLAQTDVALALGLRSAQYISNVERGLCRLASGHYEALGKMWGTDAVGRLVNAARLDDIERLEGELRVLRGLVNPVSTQR